MKSFSKNYNHALEIDLKKQLGNKLCSYFSYYEYCCRKQIPFQWGANTSSAAIGDKTGFFSYLPLTLELMSLEEMQARKKEYEMDRDCLESKVLLSVWNQLWCWWGSNIPWTDHWKCMAPDLWYIIQPKVEETMQKALKDYTKSGYRKWKRRNGGGEVKVGSENVIHYRLGDILYRRGHQIIYHLQRYEWYKKALLEISKLNPEKDEIVILTNLRYKVEKVENKNLSVEYLKEFVNYLEKELGFKKIVVETEGTVDEDFCRMLEAKVLIASVSSFSFMAGMGASSKLQKVFIVPDGFVNLLNYDSSSCKNIGFRKNYIRVKESIPSLLSIKGYSDFNNTLLELKKK